MEDATGRLQDPDDASPLTEGSHEILWRGPGAARLERLVTADPDAADTGEPHLRNVYLIGDHESALVVNAAFDAHGIVEASQGRLVPAVVFTSGSAENTGAAPLVAEWVDGMTLLHPADLPLWRRVHGDPATGVLSGYSSSSNPALAAILGTSVYEPSGDLSPGERFSIAGCKIIALHTPGSASESVGSGAAPSATPGSMSFHCPEGAWVITENPGHPLIAALPAGTAVFPATGSPFIL